MSARLRSAGPPALLLVPGALTVLFSFNGGGFFPGTVGVGAVLLLVAIVLHVGAARRPFAGLSVPLVVAGGTLGALALWTLLSQNWSHAPSRALLEFDRTLLYLLALVGVGLMGRTADRARWLVRGIAAAAFVVCAVALITRVAPDVWPTRPSLANQRLSYPLTYWNALGVLAAIGVVLCFHLTTNDRERPLVRVLGAGALPVLAATLFFTFSRGSIAAAIVGLVAYALLGRPRGLLTGALAAAPATAIAVVSAYHADLLATPNPTTAAAVDQGHDVALVVGLCVAAACALRGVLLLADARIATLEGPAFLRSPRAHALLAAAVVVVAAGIAVAFGAPDAIERQYDRFVHGNKVQTPSDFRERLTDPGNNGRLVVWRVATENSRTERWHGHGAGTFQFEWDLRRGPRNVFEVTDAHSLYLETIYELGVPGLVLLLVVLLLALGRLAWLARGPDRAVYAALAATGLAWALHAGIDWDWEMPAVTLWLFAAAGLALAAPLPSGDSTAPAGRELPRLGRIVIGLACLFLAITPARIGRSEARLQDARKAFEAGDCPRAIDRALAAKEDVDSRPEPYEILGFCDVRSGYPELGARVMRSAVVRDPRNWEYRYALALVRGAAGLDPRPAAAEAVRLNPREGLARTARERFSTSDPREWRRRALGSPLPK